MLPDLFPVRDFADSVCINPNLFMVLFSKVGFALIGISARLLGNGEERKAC
jgi:hypothetical protein